MIFDLLDQIGNCQLYHDYRSGSFRDWSGNGHNGTPSSAVSLGRHGMYLTPSGTLVVSYSSDLDFGSKDASSILVYFPGGLRVYALSNISYVFSNAVSGEYFGINDVSAGTGRMYLQVDGTASFKTISDIKGDRLFGFSWGTTAEPEFYLNGVFEGIGGAVLTKGAPTSGDLYIGSTAGGLRQFPTFIGAVLMFDKALTATEHAELYGALEGVRWPSKVYSHARNPQTVDPDETGLVLGCDMRAVGGKVADVSGNNDPGTVNTALTVRDALGDALEFNGVDSYVEFADSSALDVTTNFTISCWANAVQFPCSLFTKWDAVAGQRSFGFSLLVGALGVRLWLSANGSGVENKNGSIAVDNGGWRHVGATLAGGKVRFYVDGQFDREQTFSTQTTAYVGTSTLRFGKETSGTLDGPLTGQMIAPKIHNVVKDDDWFLAEYARGAKTVQFKTSWGARETTAAVASGNITNTPIEVISGTFDLVTTTINGKLTKALKCIANGQVVFPTSVFKTGGIGAAVGSFEFWAYTSSGNATRVGVVGNQASATTGAGFNGYELVFTTAVFLFKRTSGSGSILCRTADGYVGQDNWYSFRLTRNVSGEFTTYFNGVLVDVTGGSGTNPVTDTTYTESKFVVFDLDAGDMIALGALDGSYNFKKRLGVYNG